MQGCEKPARALSKGLDSSNEVCVLRQKEAAVLQCKTETEGPTESQEVWGSRVCAQTELQMICHAVVHAKQYPKTSGEMYCTYMLDY